MRKLYLYLASRSKRGIKVISILKSDTPTNAPITDVAALKLPANWSKQISDLIHDHRMLYEAHMETADSYLEFRERLTQRGFKNLPSDSNPMLDLSGNIPKADTSGSTVKRTMLRKKKS
jgi:hypothetical protein